MIQTESELEEHLSVPTPEVVETMRRTQGDIVVLGVAGKMGPTLARMARRATDLAGVTRRILGVSRFTSDDPQSLQVHGVEPLRCDLLDPAQVARLPDAPNVIYMAGRKFGSTGDESTTWAHNSYLPGLICQRYQGSRIVAFSTLNVYGLVPIAGPGARETDALNPVGEYAMSCLGRERIFEYFSKQYRTPVALLRLNYACELRYGVLVDLARMVWDDRPIPLGVGYFNVIWQGDANAMSLRALEHTASPAWVANVSGSARMSVRAVCLRFGELLQKQVTFEGTEGDSGIFADANFGQNMLGKPQMPTAQLMELIAAWVQRGGRNFGKSTHFEARDGKY
ncbi:NAD-dependent epimerase/dehydratase family protein [soil metagenome]